MLTVDEALQAVLGATPVLSPAELPLAEALGRVLAEDVFADIANPPFDNSAVDGYAVQAEEVVAASEASFVTLREIGESPAGSAPSFEVGHGECARVMTGGAIPAGADAMAMIEDVEKSGPSVRIRHQAKAGDHIRKAGSDVRAGDRVLASGAVIGAAETAALAAFGKSVVMCHGRPSVAVFSTGDELVPIESVPGPGQIRDSNRHALRAMAEQAGCRVSVDRWLPDRLEETCEAFADAAGLRGGEAADAIVVSGGVSVGDRDFVKPALENLGKLDLWRVRMKPGKPLAFGSIGRTLFFGLPGNPASTSVCFEMFVRPALLKLAGHANRERPRAMARLATTVSRPKGRTEFARSVVRWEAGGLVAEPLAAQGSGAFSSMLGANALTIVPEGVGEVSAGSMVEVILLSPPRQAPTRS